MTMQYRVMVGSPLSNTERSKVERIIGDTFLEIDEVYNKWNPHSEVSKLNKAKAGSKIRLSEKLEHFLLKTDKLVALTSGRFDPTIEAVQKVWKDAIRGGKIPSKDDIILTSKATGWHQVHIAEGYFWKDHNNLELDLGGVAKGYAIDLIVERLNDAGQENVYVEWGGEIRTSGRHPDHRPWRIFVSSMGSPDPSTALALVEMDNNAVASSGDYLQNWTVKGQTYFHIIDPKTCQPLIATQTTVCSATVIAEDCMTADVLATAAMMFSSPKEAMQWMEEVKEEIPGLQYWISSREDIANLKKSLQSADKL